MLIRIFLIISSIGKDLQANEKLKCFLSAVKYLNPLTNNNYQKLAVRFGITESHLRMSVDETLKREFCLNGFELDDFYNTN